MILSKQSTLQRISDKYGRQGTANLSLLLGARQGEHPAGGTSKESSWAPQHWLFCISGPSLSISVYFMGTPWTMHLKTTPYCSVQADTDRSILKGIFSTSGKAD